MGDRTCYYIYDYCKKLHDLPVHMEQVYISGLLYKTKKQDTFLKASILQVTTK